MYDYSEILSKAAAYRNYNGLRQVMEKIPPDMPNPALCARVEEINRLRSANPAFIPTVGQPDPAAAAIAEMRSLVPAQVGMLLCTVPACQGMFAFCDGTRYTFWTESKYTLITGQSAPTSALLLMPAGQHMAAIAVFPFCETEAQQENPIFNLPKQFAASVIDLQPGTVTEIIAARKNIKKVLDYHIIVH